MINETIMGESVWLPDHDPEVLHHSRTSVTSVLEGEYSYPRETPEDVHTIVDVGLNLGAFALWACHRWWPGKIESIVAFDPHFAVFEYAARNTAGLPINAMHAAVTTNPAPLFSFEEAHPANWGGAHTRGATGVAVPAFHPRDLPPCDVLKIDCEGCELEVFENYRYFDGVKVCMFEFHEVKFRDPMMGKMRDLGFVMKRGNPVIDTAPDVQVWVRP